MPVADLVGTRPDAERVVVELLAEIEAEVSAAFNPAEDFPLPAVLVHRAGGGTAGHPPVLDAAVIGIDVYAETKPEAWDLTADVLETLLAVEGEMVGSPPFAWVAAVEDAGATIWLPDETTGRARYSTVVRVYARGESAIPAP